MTCPHRIVLFMKRWTKLNVMKYTVFTVIAVNLGHIKRVAIMDLLTIYTLTTH